MYISGYNGKDIMLPKADIGDLLVVSKAGSYSYTLTPVLFASYPPPLQFYIKENGEIFTGISKSN